MSALLRAASRPSVRWGIPGALVLGVTGWLAVVGGNGPDPSWTDVRRDDLVLTVEVTGELKAVSSSFVGPPPVSEVWDFKIAFLAPEGAQVKKGQKVMAFDASELERRLEEQLAEADAARTKIEKARADADLAARRDGLRLAEAQAKERKAALKVDVPESLLASNELHAARLELEEARREIAFLGEKMAATRRAEATQIEAFESQRDGAERRVAATREAIERMSVEAVRDGTVVYVSNWRDEKKKVGDSVWRGEKVLEIPDLTKMMARGEVAEADAGRIAVGQTARFRLDAHPDVAFEGTIESIWSTVQKRSWRDPVKVVRLDLALEETDPQRMRPGMRFRGTIETERIEKALVVPAEAVFLKDAGPVAFRRRTFGWERVPLELGRRTTEAVEVLGGLTEGDRVARRDLEADRREGS